jgi:C1A family cysteine protease
MRDHFPPCYDQGDLGSCTAQSISGLLEFAQLRQPGGGQNFTPSRLFIYYGERKMEGTLNEDAGAQIRSGIKVVADDGAPPEEMWPYDIDKFARRPTRKSYREAKKHQAISYERVCQRIEDVRGCLADGYPFAFGFSVYDAFESDEVARTGILTFPKSDETMLGGHAVVCVGYDNDKSIIFVRNSWGTDWGLSGYFTMPYEYLLDRDLADDFWSIRLIEEVGVT